MSAVRNRVTSAHRSLRDAISAASASIAADVRRLVVRNLSDGGHEEFCLFRGQWTLTTGGLKMMLIDDEIRCANTECPMHHLNTGCSICTRVLAEGMGARCPAHSHMFKERVRVIQGTMIDHTTGMEYGEGEDAYFEEGATHEIEIFGMVLICWQPPLPVHSADELDKN